MKLVNMYNIFLHIIPLSLEKASVPILLCPDQSVRNYGLLHAFSLVFLIIVDMSYATKWKRINAKVRIFVESSESDDECQPCAEQSAVSELNNSVHSENDNFSPDESEHSDSEVSNDATDAGSVNSDSDNEYELDLQRATQCRASCLCNTKSLDS